MTATGSRSTPPGPGQARSRGRGRGRPLLHAAQTGDVSVREQAMRAIAMIQPPETTEAFAAGLKDACGDIRMVASAGWMNATAISEEAIPALVEALGDPGGPGPGELCARPGPARRHPRRGHPPAHRVYGRRQRRPADERGDGPQAGPGRRGHRGDAAPGRRPELARAPDRRRLPPRRGTGQHQRRVPSWWRPWKTRPCGSARRRWNCSNPSVPGARRSSKA